MNRATGAHRPIFEHQARPQILEFIRADTWYYRCAKRIHALRLTGTLALALLAPVLLFWEPGWGDFVGALAGAWVLFGRTTLVWIEDRCVARAATIQEQYDVELFDLPWNEALVGPRAALEDVHGAASHVKKEKDIERFRTWYAEDVDAAPWPLNVVLCQRSSAVWGRRSHLGYAIFVAVVAVLWLIAGIVMVAANNGTLAEYLIKVFLPSQPAFLDALDLFRGHLKQSQEKGDLEQRCSETYNRGVAESGSATEIDCREIQDRSYALRRRGMQIPEIVYKLLRTRYEEAMREAVDRLSSFAEGEADAAPQ